MKKTYLKIILLFVVIIAAASCSSDNNSLTKDYILEHLKQYETKHPIVGFTIILNSKIKTQNEFSNGRGYYSQLFKEGYLETALRTDIPNPETTSRPYQVISTAKATPFIIAKEANGSVKVKTYEINAIEVKEIKMISEVKADVTVVFKKTKTPFYNIEFDVSTNKNKLPKGDIHERSIQFNKSYTTNEWKFIGKIIL